MNFELVPLCIEHMQQFKKDMQESFQKGAMDRLGEITDDILPESHIDRSFSAKGSIAYEALIDKKRVGGAIVIIDEKTQHNHLDFLYVKVGTQGKGVGLKIWKAIEKLHPYTRVWNTCTPYFEKRNIHFYMNKCGFRAVEFFNKYHIDPSDPGNPSEEFTDNGVFEGMFRLEKVMK